VRKNKDHAQRFLLKKPKRIYTSNDFAKARKNDQKGVIHIKIPIARPLYCNIYTLKSSLGF
jgi:hypothetical protein